MSGTVWLVWEDENLCGVFTKESEARKAAHYYNGLVDEVPLLDRWVEPS